MDPPEKLPTSMRKQSTAILWIPIICLLRDGYVLSSDDIDRLVSLGTNLKDKERP